MQINSVQNPSPRNGINPAIPGSQPEKAAPNSNANNQDKGLTVSISPEAQALQKAFAAKKADETERTDGDRATQQAQPRLQAERPGGKPTLRIDLSV